MSPGDVLGHEADGHRARGRSRGQPDSRPAIGSWCRSRSPADTAGCANDPCIPVRDDSGARARQRAPRCSATRSCTARCPAAKPSTSGCRKRSTPTSWCRRAARRPLHLPLRRAAYRLAGGGVRSSAGRRIAAGPGPRPDRRHGMPDSPATWIDTIIAVDLVPERLERARARGVQVDRPATSTKMISPTWSAS